MPNDKAREECGDPITSGEYALQEPEQTHQEILTGWMKHFDVTCMSQIKDSKAFDEMTKHLPGVITGYKIDRDYFFVIGPDTLWKFYYKDPSVCVVVGTIFPC